MQGEQGANRDQDFTFIISTIGKCRICKAIGKLPDKDGDVLMDIEGKVNHRGGEICVVSDGRNVTFTDFNVRSGVGYYYVFFSPDERSFREGIEFGPILITEDVHDARVIALPDGLRIAFKRPDGCTQVLLWRSEGVGTDPVELPIHNKMMYDDRGLVPGKVYHYLIVARYNIGGKRFQSDGLVVSGSFSGNISNDGIG